MKEKIIYICEICGSTYSSKKLAEACEKIGIPFDFDKFLGKWFFAPIQTFIDKDLKDSSSIDSKVDWRLVRIDGNELIGNKNMNIRLTLGLESLSHKIKYIYKTFDDGGILINDLFNQKIEVDKQFYNILNKALVNMEMNRNRDDFKEWQRNDSINIMNNILRRQELKLPDIIGIEKYNYSNEIEKNV